MTEVKDEKGNIITSNKYNGEGLRVKKTTNNETTGYIYEGNNPIIELDGNKNIESRNEYVGNTLLSRSMNDLKYNYLYNGHGDVVNLINEFGETENTYYYDSFGNVEESEENIKNPFKYSKYELDDETGLYYLKSRMYDPTTARFMQMDTYKGQSNDPLSLNLYTYCVNEPMMYTDPTGFSPISVLKDWLGLDSASKYWDNEYKELEASNNGSVSKKAGAFGIGIMDSAIGFVSGLIDFVDYTADTVYNIATSKSLGEAFGHIKDYGGNLINGIGAAIIGLGDKAWSLGKILNPFSDASMSDYRNVGSLTGDGIFMVAGGAVGGKLKATMKAGSKSFIGSLASKTANIPILGKVSGALNKLVNPTTPKVGFVSKAKAQINEKVNTITDPITTKISAVKQNVVNKASKVKTKRINTIK